MKKLYFTASLLILALLMYNMYAGSHTREFDTSDARETNVSQMNLLNKVPLIDENYRCPDCNVILISIDTLRADHLGVYGYERNTSPNIDKFSMENIRFSNHITTSASTLPSHTSMFTGLYPKNHDILSNGWVLNDSLITLAEILEEEGYETMGIISSEQVLGSRFGISQGFGEYLDDANRTNATLITKRAISWLEKNNREDSFFLFMHYWDPHLPYNAPSEFHLWGNKSKVSLYDADIRYLDDNLKKLFDFLNENGFFNNTLIILTADHGEALGEKGLEGHGSPLYEMTVHVPLIIHLPGLNKKTKIEYQTSSVDLLPTILDILDIKRSLYFDGISLLGTNIEKRKYVFIQRKHCPTKDDPVDWGRCAPINFEFGNKSAVRSNEFKYIYRTQSEDELYHLTVDPDEEYNLINKSIGVAQELKKILVDWLNETKEIHISDKEVDEETRERLKALGYIV